MLVLEISVVQLLTMVACPRCAVLAEVGGDNSSRRLQEQTAAAKAHGSSAMGWI